MEVLSDNTLGLILLAVIMILLLSASMSTLGAIVLTSASAVSNDLILSIRKKKVAPDKQMLLTRVFCLVFVAEWTLDKAIEMIKQNSRHYAKRQMTWWRNKQSIV